MTRLCSRTRSINSSDLLTTGEWPIIKSESDNGYSDSLELWRFTVGESLRCSGGFWRVFAIIFARLSQNVNDALTLRAHLLHRNSQLFSRAPQALGVR